MTFRELVFAIIGMIVMAVTPIWADIVKRNAIQSDHPDPRKITYKPIYRQIFGKTTAIVLGQLFLACINIFVLWLLVSPAGAASRLDVLLICVYVFLTWNSLVGLVKVCARWSVEYELLKNESKPDA